MIIISVCWLASMPTMGFWGWKTLEAKKLNNLMNPCDPCESGGDKGAHVPSILGRNLKQASTYMQLWTGIHARLVSLFRIGHGANWWHGGNWGSQRDVRAERHGFPRHGRELHGHRWHARHSWPTWNWQPEQRCAPHFHTGI